MPFWAILGAGVLGAGASIFGSTQQANAAGNSTAAQEQLYTEGLNQQSKYFAQGQQAQQPFLDYGASTIPWLSYEMGIGANPLTGGNALGVGASGTLTAPYNASTFFGTPGYQVALGQGLSAAGNANIVTGGGGSGNAARALTSFATGEAGSQYNANYSNWLQQQLQAYNMLTGNVNIGANSANALTSMYGGGGNTALTGATTTGQGVGQSTAAVGNAFAGGAAGVANSGGGALSNYALLSYLQSQQQLPYGDPSTA